jgi:hypothetical protein
VVIGGDFLGKIIFCRDFVGRNGRVWILSECSPLSLMVLSYEHGGHIQPPPNLLALIADADRHCNGYF